MPKYWEKKICGIYKITHRESGMCYIGLSVHIFKRWNSHVSTKKKYKLHEAFDQFGINAFSFEVVEECDKKELRKREKWWIAHFDCVWPKGYNMNKGGSGKVNHSAKTKKKISAKHKGKTLSEETCRKISKTLKERGTVKGKNNPMYGKKHTKESRLKMSESTKGQICSEETRRKMSKTRKGKALSVNKMKSECEWCGKIASLGNIKRWHGDNCKHRKTTLSSD